MLINPVMQILLRDSYAAPKSSWMSVPMHGELLLERIFDLFVISILCVKFVLMKKAACF